LLLCRRISEEVADQTIRFLDGPEGIALVGDVHGHDADADRLAIAWTEHGMQLDEHAAARRGEFDVVRLSGNRLAQALGQGGRQARQRVSAFVMLVHRQSIEPGERLVDPDEVQARVAESQPDGDIPDGVQEAPSRVHEMKQISRCPAVRSATLHHSVGSPARLR